MHNKTKIIATMGPSCEDEKIILKLIKSGVNVFRINLSHTNQNQLVLYIKTVQNARTKLGVPVGIMIDTRGPEIRIENFENNSVFLKKGHYFSFVSDKVIGNSEVVSINQPLCIEKTAIGSIILADDGRIKFKVMEKTNNKLICKVISSGELSNNKSLWFKNQHFNFEYLNEQDKQDIKLALEYGIEYISASFVRSVNDLIVLKKFVNTFDSNIKIISKIENRQGLNNLDEIVKNSDGVMVARGDLGVEVNFEKLPIYQRKIINIAHKYSKISIVATEMLESMIYSNRPTRAEISDISKAVFDGTSAVMLSGETARGKSPIECVKVMKKILKEAESEFNYYSEFIKLNKNPKKINDLIIQSAVNASFYLNCKAIVSYTSRGNNALKLSTKFSVVPIIAVTEDKKTYNALALFFNTLPIYSKKTNDIFNQAEKLCVEHCIAKNNDYIIVTTGNSDNISNVLKFQQIKNT